jgi:phage gpG-like protein
MITIETSGLNEIIIALNEIQKPIDKTIPKGLDKITQIVEDSTYQNFIQAGRPTWPERRNIYPHPPLMKTLAMMEGALDTAQIWHHKDRKHDIDISSTEYAHWQQFGTDGKGPNLPPRLFANTVEEEEEQIEKILYNEIEALF